MVNYLSLIVFLVQIPDFHFLASEEAEWHMVKVRNNLEKAIHKLQDYWKKFIEKDFIRHQRFTPKSHLQQQKRWRFIGRIKRSLEGQILPHHLHEDSKPKVLDPSSQK